jgi:D-methionine transport system substrate-binding protein
MGIKRLLTALAAAGIVAISLTGCGHKTTDTKDVIKVGTMAGPETQLMEVAKQVAAKNYGLDVEIVTFTDFNQPNEALSNGSIDANMFQHLPYLNAAIQAHGYQIIPIGKTFIYPMGIYSKHYQNITDINEHDVIAIPNDPSNEARALLLLQKAGLITLKNGGNATSTPMDITNNPHDIQIKPLDAAQLPRVLPDVAFAVINTNYAIPAGLLPSRDAVFIEDKDSPYANLVVVRSIDAQNVNVLHLVDALHSPQVEQAAQKIFQGQVVPAW